MTGCYGRVPLLQKVLVNNVLIRLPADRVAEAIQKRRKGSTRPPAVNGSGRSFSLPSYKSLLSKCLSRTSFDAKSVPARAAGAIKQESSV